LSKIIDILRSHLETVIYDTVEFIVFHSFCNIFNIYVFAIETSKISK